VNISYSHEQSLLDTGGGIRRALPMLGKEPFLILNGDIWTDFDFSVLPSSLGSDLAHLVLIDRPAHRELGDFDLQGDRVRRDGNREMVYPGISVLAPELFVELQVTTSVFSLTRDLLFDVSRQGRVGGQRFAGTWFDIGSPDQLAAARASHDTGRRQTRRD
jgi:MurNAc alpha-1-phosphate uridylyltransferase